MKNKDLAMTAAALKVCLKLQNIRELDEFMHPIGKDTPSHYHHHAKEYSKQTKSNSSSKPSSSNTNPKTATTSSSSNPNGSLENQKEARPGTTKRRQYYYKQVATCLKEENLKNATNSKLVAKKSNSNTKLECQADSENMIKLEDNSELDKKDVAIENQPESYDLDSFHVQPT